MNLLGLQLQPSPRPKMPKNSLHYEPQKPPPPKKAAAEVPPTSMIPKSVNPKPKPQSLNPKPQTPTLNPKP